MVVLQKSLVFTDIYKYFIFCKASALVMLALYTQIKPSPFACRRLPAVCYPDLAMLGVFAQTIASPYACRVLPGLSDARFVYSNKTIAICVQALACRGSPRLVVNFAVADKLRYLCVHYSAERLLGSAAYVELAPLDYFLH